MVFMQMAFGPQGFCRHSSTSKSKESLDLYKLLFMLENLKLSSLTVTTLERVSRVALLALTFESA